MNNNSANQLSDAGSAEGYSSGQSQPADWRAVASLKAEVDRLVWCDLNRAERLADQACELASAIGDPLSAAFADAIRARVLDNLGRHSESDGLYEKAAATMRKARLTREAAVVEKQHLTPLIHLGWYDRALQKARGARRVLAKSEPLHYAQLEANVGNIYYRLDQYGKALARYERARELLASAGDESMVATVDFSKSNVLADTDRPDEALELLRSAEATFRGAGRLVQAGQAKFQIAYLEYLRGNYHAALEGYCSARDSLTELGSQKLAAYCSLFLAELLLALNAFDEAALSADKAQTVFEALEMPFESARGVLARGLAEMGSGQLERSREDFLRSREAFARTGNKVFTAITDSYLAELSARRGELQEAAMRASSSLRFFDRHGLSVRAAHCRLQLARAALQAGDFARALRLAQSALTSVERAPSRSVIYQCHHLRGCVERERSHPKKARDAFLQSVETIEQMRVGVSVDEFKATFLRDKIAVYEDAISACLDDGRRELMLKAFEIVEACKSRALAELISRYTGRSPSKRHRDDNRNRSRTNDVHRLIEQMNWYASHAIREEDSGSQGATAAHYRKAVLRYEREIAAYFRRDEARGVAGLESPISVTAHGLCESLKDGEAAIEYFVTGDEISAFVATELGIRVARNIGSVRRVELMLSGLRFQLRKFGYGSDYLRHHQHSLEQAVDRHLTGLRTELFEPLEGMLGDRRLLVIPHGILHYVPFQALRTDRGYLCDELEISYAPSALVFVLCRQTGERARKLWRELSLGKRSDSARRAKRQMVAVGLSDAETPNIRHEIAALADLFPDSVRILEGDATRENLLRVAGSARFLHIATHGYFQHDNPMFSYLALADGRLNFYDLLDLNLSAEMVTLSACETGANAVMPGDELHGLMRGFLQAGTPSLVLSLWSVNDQATADLMKLMYRHICEGESKRSALRKAQLAVRESYPHPYYWAPFVLIGCPD